MFRTRLLSRVYKIRLLFSVRNVLISSRFKHIDKVLTASLNRLCWKRSVNYDHHNEVSFSNVRCNLYSHANCSRLVTSCVYKELRT